MPGRFRPRTIKEWQRALSKALLPLVPNAPKEVLLLLKHHLGCDELYILTNPDKKVPKGEKLITLLKRRMENEPLEYITQKADFYGREFFVDKRVLIPRPETELLIDEVLKRVQKDQKLHFVEVGIGSGIISITLALCLPYATFVATDISQDALVVAKENIQRYNLQNRITLKHTNVLDGVDENIDYLISNPPYIQEGFALESNLSYEPQNALFGGTKGDEIIKELINQTLKKKIKFFTCEIGYDQKDTIADYIEKTDAQIAFYKDYAGFDRGFSLELEKC